MEFLSSQAIAVQFKIKKTLTGTLTYVLIGVLRARILIVIAYTEIFHQVRFCLHDLLVYKIFSCFMTFLEQTYQPFLILPTMDLIYHAKLNSNYL